MSTFEMICWGALAAYVAGVLAYVFMNLTAPVLDEGEDVDPQTVEDHDAYVPAGGGF